MKAAILAIRPKWCEKIASGEKSVEVRKTRPKLDVPFKCYIYQTKDMKSNTAYGFRTWARRGKVIGEFVCDDIIKDNCGENADLFSKCALLSLDEQKKYGTKNPLYGWHISELKIYDNPRGLGEFLTPSETGGVSGNHYLSRPPQSWCYVEEEV